MARAEKKLPRGSLAVIVHPAWGDGEPIAKPRPATPLARSGIGWELYGVEPPRHRVWFTILLGGVVAVVLHIGVVVALWSEPPSTPGARAPMVVVEHEVELTEPEVAPPEPPEEAAPETPPEDVPPPEPTPAAPVPPPDSAPSPAPPQAGPPPPAQAGEVIAAESSEPVEFSGFDIATGEGSRYAGGVTASTGTNTEAVHTRNVDPDAPPGRAEGRGDLTRPVTLPARNWSCPWPREADALGIDEQVVVLRAVVSADGRASSVDVLADPGHGFGEAARRCAETARFQPARDEAGDTYAATSPPIRVRFTR